MFLFFSERILSSQNILLFSLGNGKKIFSHFDIFKKIFLGPPKNILILVIYIFVPRKIENIKCFCVREKWPGNIPLTAISCFSLSIQLNGY